MSSICKPSGSSLSASPRYVAALVATGTTPCGATGQPGCQLRGAPVRTIRRDPATRRETGGALKAPASKPAGTRLLDPLRAQNESFLGHDGARPSDRRVGGDL